MLVGFFAKRSSYAERTMRRSRCFSEKKSTWPESRRRGADFVGQQLGRAAAIRQRVRLSGSLARTRADQRWIRALAPVGGGAGRPPAPTALGGVLRPLRRPLRGRPRENP